VVPLRTLLDETRATATESKRPLAALTFDDGYADVVRDVLPRCQARGVVGMVFPVATHHADHRQPLWFDTLYRILETSISPTCTDADPLIEGIPLSSWVRGPEKEALQTSPPEARQLLLRLLAARLGVGVPDEPDLYLSEGDLRQLVELGWSVGAHGTVHTRFTVLRDLALHEELRRSLAFVRSFDAGEPILAYPDGAHDTRVRAALPSFGIRRALTVTPGPVNFSAPFDPLATPRYLCRGDEPVPHPALQALALSMNESPVVSSQACESAARLESRSSSMDSAHGGS
jgi:peptidoglycan/xylan/chitin deacetylase (PgdA/CDA1 family)